MCLWQSYSSNGWGGDMATRLLSTRLSVAAFRKGASFACGGWDGQRSREPRGLR